MAAEQPKSKVILISCDKIPFEVEQDVAFKSQIIRDAYIDMGGKDGEEMKLTYVDGATLKKILDYCVAFRNEVFIRKERNEDPRIELTDKHIVYLEGIPDDLFVKVINSAEYLNIPDLVAILAQKIYDVIQGLTAARIRELLKLDDDLSEELKQEVRVKYPWILNM